MAPWRVLGKGWHRALNGRGMYTLRLHKMVRFRMALVSNSLLMNPARYQMPVIIWVTSTTRIDNGLVPIGLIC